MNENLNLIEILKGCPEGTEFYCPLFGKVLFSKICSDVIYPIRTNRAPFTSDGKYLCDFNGECMLFPSKDQRDWAKFERFWDKSNTEKFDANIDLIKILEGCPKGTKFYSIIHGEITFKSIEYTTNYPIRFYSDITGGSVPLTREGKTIRNAGECIVFPSKYQRDWSKFERFWDKPKVEKFDVNTLQPFDKILVRNYLGNPWSIDLFSRRDCNTVRGLLYNCRWVIPYNDETKHLLGTTNDCPEYYKWWENRYD